MSGDETHFMFLKDELQTLERYGFISLSDSILSIKSEFKNWHNDVLYIHCFGKDLRIDYSEGEYECSFACFPPMEQFIKRLNFDSLTMENFKQAIFTVKGVNFQGSIGRDTTFIEYQLTTKST